MTRRLLLLNGLAVLGVALHHAAAFGLQAMFTWTDRYRAVSVPNYDQLGSLTYYGLISVRQLVFLSLPAFMFVSGFFIAFMAGSSDSRLKWGKILPRIKMFAAPFLLWTALRFIMLRHFPSSLDELLGPYYYLPLLILYYLLAPFLVPVARKHSGLLLCAAAIFEFGFITVRYLLRFDVEIPGSDWIVPMVSLPNWLPPNLFFWCVLGIVVGLHHRQIATWLPRVKWLLLVLGIVLALLIPLEYEVVDRLTGEQWLGPRFIGFTQILFSLDFILALLAFSKSRIPFSKELSQLGSQSLGVYLANTPSVFVVALLMYHYMPWALGIQLIYQLVLIAAGLGIPLLLMRTLRRSRYRGFYRYVFG